VQIRDVMKSESLQTVGPQDNLGLAAQLMLWAGVRHLPVVREGAVIGVLSERDILRHDAEVGAKMSAQQPVERAMRAPAITVGPDESLVAAVTLMLSRKVGCLPVVSAAGLVGMITTTDILRNDLEEAVERAANSAPPPIRSIMKRPTSVGPQSWLFQAATLMNARGIRHLPVVDEEGKVVGILSDRDVRAALGDPRQFIANPGLRTATHALRVASAMSKVVITMNQDAPLTSAVEHFVNQGIGALPIVDDGQRLVGMVSYIDVIQALR
jgi:CBS domain-containing protein